MIKNRKRNITKYFCVTLLSMICGITLLSASGNALEVNAAGNTPIHTITGTESHSHTVTQSMFGSATDYTESYYKNTGVQIYGTSNSGSTSSGTSVELDTNSFYVDFTGSSNLYTPSSAYEGMCVTLDY